jgi:opacity protein-like surface antigen
MSRLNLITGAAMSAIVLATAGAKAADMPVYYEPEPIFGGWYLRGDVGITNQRADSVYNAFWDLAPGINDVVIHDQDFEASWLLGIGVGYRFNEWFRADITGEYRGPSDFDALDSIDNDIDPEFDVVNDYDAEKTEWTFLLNAYWDFYTWEKVTFFVGAGAGASYNKISDLTDTNLLDPGGGPSCPSSNGCAGDNGQWQFAWALHAGAAFAVAPNIAIELAYRYLNLGDAESDDIIGSGGGNLYDNPFEFDDLTSHDVKIGLRYTFQ